MKMVVAFDLDDVLVDTMIVDSVLSEHGLSRRDFRDFSFTGLPEHVVSEIYRRFNSPEHNRDPRVLPGAIEAVKWVVASGAEAVVITARPTTIEDVTRETVARHFPAISACHVTGGCKRAALRAAGATWLIDDAVHNLESAREVGVEPILFSDHRTVWNHTARDAGGFKVLSSLSDLPSFLPRLGR